MKRKRVSVWACALAICSVALPPLLLAGCGGGGSNEEPRLTAHGVSEKFANASTPEEMHQAMVGARRLTALDQSFPAAPDGVESVSDLIYGAVEGFELDHQASDDLTFGEVFDAVNNDEELGDNLLNMTAAQAVDYVNTRLPAAYANPDSGVNATLVLLSSVPGAIPTTAPTMTVDTRLGPLQQVMLIHYLASVVSTRVPCWVCDVAYLAALGAIQAFLIGCRRTRVGIPFCQRTAANMRRAASAAYTACLATCHEQ